VVTSVAVVSDIHGVLPALDAVLAEPEVQAADRIVATGDIAAGPQPVEVLDRLISLGDRVVLVRGNCERELADLVRDEKRESPYALMRWAADQLRPEYVELFDALPHPVTLDVDGFGPVLFCHGTPRDDNEIVLVDTRLAKWAEVFADVPDDVRTIVCGHTHMPFARLAHGRMIVNPGSVGMPYGRTGAHWALLGPGVQLRRTRYDNAALSDRVVAESAYPGVAGFADFFLRSSATDAEVIEAFGPRDGRPA
jgi:predicted phosphodiesterase